MSITTIESQFVFALANIVTTTTIINSFPMWPIRWPNENWVKGVGGVIALNNENAPADANGFAAPFVEAEVISGHDSACISSPGQRQSTTIGLLRVYLVTPQGSGRGPINILADAVHDALKRTTVYINPPERLTTMDPRIDDNVAEHTAQTDVRIDSVVPAPWKAARFVRLVTVPWIFDYYS